MTSPLMALYVSPSQLTLLTPNNPEGISRHLPSGVISHMSIEDKDQLFRLVAEWFEELKFSAHQGMLIISSKLTFEKIIPSASAEDMNGADSFAQLVPFERVITRVYTLEGQMHSINMDHDLVDMFRLLFQKHQIPLATILPETVAAILGKESSLTPTAVSALFKVWTTLDEQSIIPVKDETHTIQEKEQAFSQKHAGLVISIFLAFLAVLASVTWFFLTRK